MRLGDHATAQGYRARWFESLGSTNDEAMALARAGDPGALWVCAGEQTAGRGRQGRPWSSPRGNLHASLLLVDPCSPRHAAQLGFVAGVALVDALRCVAPAAAFGLKWPNDVLSGGAKLAGLLVEGATLADGRFACVLGFGVDCGESPAGLPYPATNLRELGAPCPPQALLAPLADAVCRGLELWRAGAGFPAIRQAWLARAAALGRPLEARTHAGVLRGIFEMIDEQGRLVLATAKGRVTVEAGDVFPVPEAGETVSADGKTDDAQR